MASSSTSAPTEFEPLRDAGIGVLLVEYPGYGRSAGRPSEDSITATMLAAYDSGRRRPALRCAAHHRPRPLAGRRRDRAARRAPPTRRAGPRVDVHERGGCRARLRRARLADHQAIRYARGARGYRGPVLIMHGARREHSGEHAHALKAAAPTCAHCTSCPAATMIARHNGSWCSVSSPQTGYVESLTRRRPMKNPTFVSVGAAVIRLQCCSRDAVSPKPAPAPPPRPPRPPNR